MTLKIKLSELTIAPEVFTARVTAFVVAMKEYAAHLEGVKIDAANETLKPAERRVVFPGPSEEPLIERAAHEGYEFTGPTLDEKKAALFAKVRELETEALNSIVPPHKARHWSFVEADARQAHSKRVADFHKSHAAVHFEQNEIPAMTPEEADIVREADARRARQQSVQRRAAKHEHDIGELTEETIAGYKLESFGD